MNINEKKIYLRANELYREGKTAEALKLWASINQTKKSAVDIEPLIWKLIRAAHLIDFKIGPFVVGFIYILYSFFFGRMAFLLFAVLGELLYFKSFPDVYIFLSNLTIDEQGFISTIFDQKWYLPNFVNFPLAFEQYFSGKIIHMQGFFFAGHEQVSMDVPINSLLFNYSFALMIGLISFGVVGDLYLCWITYRGFIAWSRNLLKQNEFRLRFLLASIMAFISISFFILVFKTFEKSPEMITPEFFNSLDLGGDEGGGEGGSDQNQKRQSKKTESELTERKFLEEFSKGLAQTPYSLKERQAISRIYNDYVKMLKKYGIKGGNSKEQPTVQEIIDIMKNGKLSEIENKLKKIKAMNDLKKMRGENGEGEEGGLTQEDKEFSEVLKKSFMSSDANTLDEYIKTGKELEELYGKGIKDKVFSGANKEELIKKFANDPKKAREFAREETNKILEQQSSEDSIFSGTLGMDVATRINSIVNYLKSGGDIKVFNQMRMQFLKDFDDPEIRFQFAINISEVMVSWSEHQNKYFWQANRALMMEIVDMIAKAGKEVNFDFHKFANIGWFYLLAGNFEKGREECLGYIAYRESIGDFDSEGVNVNRSNAAVAALLLGLGKNAFLEYRYIYQKVLEKKGIRRNKREETFTEYIREITAALASSAPCKEAYICRSMFLEDVNDELALEDLFKYLALSPEDDLLIREANLKIKLIKKRLEIRKNK